MPKIKEIMTPSVEVVSPNATTADAARKMLDLDVGLYSEHPLPIQISMEGRTGLMRCGCLTATISRLPHSE